MSAQQQPISYERMREILGAKLVVQYRESKFPMVWCSQCGKGFGPGNSGFSHCKHHQHLTVVED
jgi:uncharacterized OB-fold protein